VFAKKAPTPFIFGSIYTNNPFVSLYYLGRNGGATEAARKYSDHARYFISAAVAGPHSFAGAMQ
jgi:hypothetical protein